MFNNQRIKHQISEHVPHTGNKTTIFLTKVSKFRAPYPIDTTASVQKAACYMYIDGTVQIGPRGPELLLMLVVVNQTTPDMYPA